MACGLFGAKPFPCPMLTSRTLYEQNCNEIWCWCKFQVHVSLLPLGSLVIQSWRRHQMGTFSALLALCAGNSPITGEFPTQRPVTRSFDVFFDLRLNKWLSKQSRGWWFETPLCPLWRHRNDSVPTWPTCDQVMACRLFSTELSPQPLLSTWSKVINFKKNLLQNA